MKSSTLTDLFLCAIVVISASPIFEGAEKAYSSLIAIVCVVILNMRSVRFSRQSIFGMLCLSIVLLVFGSINDAINGGFDTNTFGFWLVIALAFVLAATVQKEQFISAMEKTAIYTMIPGLIVWTVFQFYPSLISALPLYKYGDMSFSTLIFINFIYNDEISNRFVGFGSEPGLTQIFYTIAIYARLRRNSGRVDLIVALLCLAILLSRSTAGLIALFVVLLFMIPTGKLIKYILVASPILVLYVREEIAYQLHNKLVGSDSFAMRYDRYSYFFDSDISRLIFGMGNHYYRHIFPREDLGGYDSFLQLVQIYGLLSMICLIVLIYSANIRRPLISLLLVLGLLSQSIWLMPAFAFFYFKEANEGQKKLV